MSFSSEYLKLRNKSGESKGSSFSDQYLALRASEKKNKETQIDGLIRGFKLAHPFASTIGRAISIGQQNAAEKAEAEKIAKRESQKQTILNKTTPLDTDSLYKYVTHGVSNEAIADYVADGYLSVADVDGKLVFSSDYNWKNGKPTKAPIAPKPEQLKDSKQWFTPYDLGDAIEDSTGFAMQKLMAGLASFNKGVAATADATIGALLGTVGWENNPISALHDWTESTYNEMQGKAEGYKQSLIKGAGGGAEGVMDTFGGFTEAAGQAIPMMFPSMLSSIIGTAGAVSSATLSADAAMRSANILQKAGLSATNMIKNPQFWVSFSQQYGSTYDEATESGYNPALASLIATATSVASSVIELGFDGESGIQGLPQALKKGNSSWWKTLSKTAIQEGLEEPLQGYITDWIAKLTYDPNRNPNDWKVRGQEAALGAGVGALLGGSSIAVNAAQNAATKITSQNQKFSFTQNEQAVVDRLYEDAIAEARKKAKDGTVSKKEANAIRKRVEKQFMDGDYSTSVIQEVLGENKSTDKDVFFQSAYAQEAAKGVAFTEDLSQYKSDSARKTMENLINSKSINNTNASHRLANFLAKISENKGIIFSATDAKKLAQTGLKVGDGKTINGWVDANNNVVVNVSSKKYLHSIVGHEISHVLEGTDFYNDLQQFAIDSAKAKGEYDARLKEATELYQNEDGYKGEDGMAKIEREVVADIIGDYLFTDSDFISRLSQNRNLFQKVFDEIKYLYNVATANSTEAKQLEKLKKSFEDAYRKSGKIGDTARGDSAKSFSSIAGSFFGKENMSVFEFEEADYKQTEGYKEYVDKCLDTMKQTRSDINEDVAREYVEKSIDGIVRVAKASKNAGYDILDDAEQRNKKDSKKRLLFSSLEPNSDYFTSSDISTICDKRINFNEIYDEIVRRETEMDVPHDKRFFNNIDNFFIIHQIMAEKGLTTPCEQCYVESMRKNLAPMAKAFRDLILEADVNNKANEQLYHQSGKDAGQIKKSNAKIRDKVLRELENAGISPEYLTEEILTTADGLVELRLRAPMVYEAFNSFYGQAKPKMPKKATPFRFGELTALLTNAKGKVNWKLINKINSTGGFRLQSYSDFQIQNFVDVLQVLFEASTLNLHGHAYTKVPAFLDATDGTNLKRNISVFMYEDENGDWRLDRNDSFPETLDEIYDRVKNDKSGNTSIIAVSQNDRMSAWIMANDNVGYGIPFHKSGNRMDVVRATEVREDGKTVLGYRNIKDHTKQQSEVWKISPTHESETKVRKSIDIYKFWDFENKEGLSRKKIIEKNVKKYVDECEKLGYIPKFRDYIRNNTEILNETLAQAKKLGFVPKTATIEDISFKYAGYTIPYGYYKFLGDFGMIKPDGTASSFDPISLENYDFGKAEEFFKDAENLRRNEILQQYSNSTIRAEMRESGLTTSQLQKDIENRRSQVVDEALGIAPKKSPIDVFKALSVSKEADTKSPNENVELTAPAPVEKKIAPDSPKKKKGANIPPDMRERSFHITASESEAVNGAFKPEDIPNELRYYQVKSNRSTVEKARARLDTVGYESAVDDFRKTFYDGNVRLEDIALGELLIQEAVKRGDVETAIDLTVEADILGTELGQTIQAYSIIQRLSPEGHLRTLTKIVERGKRRGDIVFKDVQITPEIAKKILDVANPDGTWDAESLKKAVDEAKNMIAEQMGATMWDKLNGWRYFAMLGNLKTHERNILSTATNFVARMAKNAVARTVEDLILPEGKLGQNAETDKVTAPVKDAPIPNGTIVRAKDRNNFGRVIDYNAKSGKYSVQFTADNGAMAVKQFARNGIEPAVAMANRGQKKAEVEKSPLNGLRTKTWRRSTKAVKNFARETMLQEREAIQGNAYTEMSDLKSRRKIWKNKGIGKALNSATDWNSSAMEIEDSWFSLPTYRYALAEFLTANGIKTEEDIKANAELVVKAKTYALEEAKKAAFRQDSYTASVISRLESKNAVTKVVIGSAMPFKKTVINVAKTGVAYSPLGFARGIRDLTRVKSGAVAKTTAIDHLAEGFTGSSLLLIGLTLASLGILNGKGKDDKKGSYEYQLGRQRYSVNIGDASFSLSWLAPATVPLFIGANLYEEFVEGKDVDFNVFVDSLARTLDPIADMSFVSSLDEVLSSYDSGFNRIGGMAETIVQNYVSQYFPTLLSQVAQTADSKKRTTKPSKDSKFVFGEQTLKEIAYKIPGARNLLEPQTDIWGNDVMQEDNILLRGFNAFINPSLVREDKTSDVDYALMDLYEEIGDSAILPKTPNNYLDYKGEKYEMSSKEHTEFKQTFGQEAYDLLDDLINTDTYKNATAEQRADMVDAVYQHASDKAKKEYLDEQGVEYTNAKKDGIDVYKENLIVGAIKKDMPVDEYKLYSENPQRYSLTKAVGGYDRYATETSAMNKIRGTDEDGDGKTDSGSVKKNVIRYLASLDIPQEQKLVLFKSKYPADDTYNDEIIAYIAGLDISKKDKLSIFRELGFDV